MDKNTYTENIFNETKENTNYRNVLFTGKDSQLVVMDIKPGDDIGEEVHEHTEQTLFLLSGTGKSILDGIERLFEPGDVVVVTPGVKHNFVNTGKESLKIFTLYAPPHHLHGRKHATKADADADTEDEEFGERAPDPVNK